MQTVSIDGAGDEPRVERVATGMHRWIKRGVAVADVTDLAAVLTGEGSGRSSPEAVTLFDSTGLAIQDLAIAATAYAAARAGRVAAPLVEL